MQLEARLDVRIVELTDAVQVSLYWALMRAWALDFKAERSDQGGLVTALEDGVLLYQRSTTV